MDRLRETAMYAAAWAACLRASPPPLVHDSERDGEAGQGLAEYALILALVALVAIVGLALMGENIREYIFEYIAGTIQDVVDLIS